MIQTAKPKSWQAECGVRYEPLRLLVELSRAGIVLAAGELIVDVRWGYGLIGSDWQT